MRDTHLTVESLENLYTLDPQDADIMENSNSVQREQMKKYINAVMETALTERQRQIVELYFELKDPTFEKVAAAEGISRQVAGKIFKAAMKKLEVHKKIFLKTHPK